MDCARTSDSQRTSRGIRESNHHIVCDAWRWAAPHINSHHAVQPQDDSQGPLVYVRLMLGRKYSSTSRSVHFNRWNGILSLCLGNGWWLLYESQSNTYSEQHTSSGHGTSDGVSFSSHEWPSPNGCSSCRSHRTQHRQCPTDILWRWRSDADTRVIFRRCQKTPSPYGIKWHS